MRFLLAIVALFALLSGQVSADSCQCSSTGCTRNGVASTCGTPITSSHGLSATRKENVKDAAAETGTLPTTYNFFSFSIGITLSYPGDTYLSDNKFDYLTTSPTNNGNTFYGTDKSLAGDCLGDTTCWWTSFIPLTGTYGDATYQSVLYPRTTALGAFVDYHGWPAHDAVAPAPYGNTFNYVVIGVPTTASSGTHEVFAILFYDCEAVNCNSGLNGDPQFSGLQGQNFQFHGMADEVFSLVSSPELQMNSLFKFIANGNCDYNNTVCWSHPGTYLGQIGIQFGANKVLLQSGSHAEGLTLLINDKQVQPSNHVHTLTTGNKTASILFGLNGDVTITTELFYFRIVNSDYFFNMDFGVKDQSILLQGARQLAITGGICERESHSAAKSHSGKVAAQLAATYPAVPLHGLLGQTWRNAVFCGRYFEGTVDDYITAGLFSNEHTFNFFTKQ